MPDSGTDPMEALITAAVRALEVHDPGEHGCTQPECVAAGLVGRCLPYRIADEVISTWANRVHLPVPAGSKDFERIFNALPPGGVVIATEPVILARPGEKAERHDAGTRVVRRFDGHPSWCTGSYCREPGAEASHVSAPDRVANVMVTLMYLEGEPPVVTLTDLANEDAESTIVVPAAFAGSLAQSVRLTGLRATTAD